MPERADTRKFLNLDASMVWVALGLLVLACLVLQPSTLTSAALLSMLPFAAVLVIAAIGQTLTIQSGGMDMSVAGSMTLAAAVVTNVADRADDRIWLACALAVVAAVVGGVVNGLAIAYLAIPPIVATLAVNALLVGVVQTYTGGVLKESAPALAELASGKVLGIPILVIVALLVVVVVSVVMGRTIVGRRLVAIGAQPASAVAAGLSVNRYVVGTYAAAGLFFGLAGVLYAGYLRTPATSVADPMLFATITAVIVGGTAFGGGRGRIVGTAVGALFVSQLDVFLTATGSPPSIAYLVQAAAIAAAVLINSPEALKKLRLSRSPKAVPA